MSVASFKLRMSLSIRAVQGPSSEQTEWLRRYISLGDSSQLSSSGKAMSPSEREQVHLKKPLPRFLRFSPFSASSISAGWRSVSLECRVAWNPAGRFADIEGFQDFDAIATPLRKGVSLESVA